MVTQEGFNTVVSHSFVEGDQYLGDDTVFGVKQSLVASYERVPEGEGDTAWRTRFDIVMVRPEETEGRHSSPAVAATNGGAWAA